MTDNKTATHARIVVVIPVYNEAPVIRAVLQEIRQQGFNRIIVVDDGSTDGTGLLARQMGAFVLQHRFNRGKGAAVKTGFAAARLLKPDIVVTIDGDGQHQSRDIARLITPLKDNLCDVALGTRRWGQAGIPMYKVVPNILANGVTWLMHRQWVNDSQSGFRAYSRRALEIIDPQADYYDYDSEIIREIHRFQLRFIEVPITVRYTAYSQAKTTRQNLASGLKTAYRMVWHLIA